MTRLGMIVRTDQGGLAAQTMEIARHLNPDAVLIVDLRGGGRGASDLETQWAPEQKVTREVPLSIGDVVWLLKRCDVLFTAETPYHDEMHAACREAGVRLVIQANPELTPEHRTADLMLNPSTYAADRYPSWEILPVPVATDRLPWSERRAPAKVFMHIAAPAMLDRNGTELVIDALRYIESEVTVRFVNCPVRVAQPGNRVTVEQTNSVRYYWQNYTGRNADVDVMLMPRRYAGLCLPAQEAAAAGIPTVALDTAPLNRWCLTIPAKVYRMQNMLGGRYPIHNAEPRDLAAMIDRLATDEPFTREAQQRTLRWALAYSWDALLPVYRRVLWLDD